MVDSLTSVSLFGRLEIPVNNDILASLEQRWMKRMKGRCEFHIFLDQRVQGFMMAPKRKHRMFWTLAGYSCAVVLVLEFRQRACAALGFYCSTVIIAVTAQNTVRV